MPGHSHIKWGTLQIPIAAAHPKFKWKFIDNTSFACTSSSISDIMITLRDIIDAIIPIAMQGSTPTHFTNNIGLLIINNQPIL
jgi:hypothetical protein